jgi:heptosyltransferase-1
MYIKNSKLPSRILIVKMSSLGDIVQSFVVLNHLKQRFPKVKIDWAVEAAHLPIVRAHPLIDRAIPLDIKGRKNLYAAFKDLRHEKYDLIFDLQGNCKSGVITLCARGKTKVGFGFRSVREWPNILATHIRYNISKKQNIRLYYLELIDRFFKNPTTGEIGEVYFNITGEEGEKIAQILSHSRSECKIMVCPGSKWVNKQLKEETLTLFLKRIEREYGATFFLIWGERAAKAHCDHLAKELKKGIVVEKLSLPTWQNLMNEMDLVIAVDSSALHLCSTGTAPSFSIFGPTASSIFKPIGKNHTAFQGKCPYNQVFEKQCPLLRNCPTGACIREINLEELWLAFQSQCAFPPH